MANVSEGGEAAIPDIDLSSYDAEQVRLMDEMCTLVDENDKVIGAADKKTCQSPHLNPTSHTALPLVVRRSSSTEVT